MIQNTTFTEQKISRGQLTSGIIQNCHFLRCRFDQADLSECQFMHCSFYDDQQRTGCSFQGANIKETCFSHCDLTMADFRNTEALGCEMLECKGQGADFRGASFMNRLTSRSFFCSASLTKNNFSYANFQNVVLEKCQLTGNRWSEANILGANFSGSDMSESEFGHIEWSSANFTHCDLTHSDLGDLNLRKVNLDGVKIDSWQQTQLLEKLGIIVVNA
ncbi:Qnr family pentapeptide repeat protein [Sodalis ligni]|uniref:Qnr family pentapeptide repeat protein n=1 Tax=Sodalis ligni TaxID=2697027 RepID=UPI00193F904C|nr:Qnr family pentapeptide repeat protein [Sodalis ligni]QWA13025.1 Qnr family pentapeptide repeat protein [Sodalis ligni]